MRYFIMIFILSYPRYLMSSIIRILCVGIIHYFAAKYFWGIDSIVFTVVIALLATIIVHGVSTFRGVKSTKKEYELMTRIEAEAKNGSLSAETMKELEEHLNNMEPSGINIPFINTFVVVLAGYYQKNAEFNKAMDILDKFSKATLDDPSITDTGIMEYYSFRITACSYLNETDKLESYYNDAMKFIDSKKKKNDLINVSIKCFKINRAIANGDIDEAETLTSPLLESDKSDDVAGAYIFMARCAAKRGDKQKVCEYLDKAAELAVKGMDKNTLELRKEYILSQMD
ncbi:tetratricopeptide repeat protein [Ruminococcus albus]|uniref:Tetratricopeptide repeat-containing protein n=2 Tax=Ruminococcus albus TaxID=1264 RepID=E6UJ58_RUMA7|nr:hypothetical protein [Ruminococcus albus]ADU23406.1 hypothetical protein Rumal_2940 [Ruminococcus albus 7 = DSM 20455]